MKIKQLIKKLESLKEGKLLDKEIFMVAPNGILFKPQIKFELKNPYDILNYTKENIESVIIDWDGSD